MTFKKDYINYLLHRAIYSAGGEFKDRPGLRRIADRIISTDDIVKLTFLTGKTAGLESLFKYLLYISDKIDKSLISVFNLKDNFEYDLKNIIKICHSINNYCSEKEMQGIESESIITDGSVSGLNIDDEVPETEEMPESAASEGDNEEKKEGMTLIENYDNTSGEGDVFELESISETVENTVIPDDKETAVEEIPEQPEEEKAEKDTTDFKTGKSDSDKIKTEPPPIDQVPEIEIEVKKPPVQDNYDNKDAPYKEESVTNEAYQKFETKFFEEVKILEKLFATVNKEINSKDFAKLEEKTIQCLTEIIEISSELSNLSRQLMFDLIADIFLTMNIYFTKAISTPDILESERIKLFDSSLALVNSLIKGEDYLNYDSIMEKIEKLKSEISETGKEKFSEGEQKKETDTIIEEKEQTSFPAAETLQEVKQAALKDETAVFKLKYLVKEFEKSFIGISGYKGEFSRFEALEKISELNNTLRLIAKISSGIKMNDVLKLAEVTYVFLKYLKDYRIDMIDPEIQQIVKYIIFTFKMLLTSRRPDDFNILVQHLNNPVKIFTDS